MFNFNTRESGDTRGREDTRGRDSVADPSYTALTVLLYGEYILYWYNIPHPHVSKVFKIGCRDFHGCVPNCVLSDKIVVNTGAPQGCVHSPILFSIYTKDISSNNSYLTLIKYADGGPCRSS